MSYQEEKAVITLYHQIAAGVVHGTLQRDPLPAVLRQEARAFGSALDPESLEQAGD